MSNIFLKVISLFLSLQLTGCLYSAEEEDPRKIFNESNEVPVEKVFDELGSSISARDITTKAVGESVHYELNQRIFTGGVSKSHDLIARVDCKHDPDVNTDPDNLTKCSPGSSDLDQFIVYQVNNYIQESGEEQGLITPYYFNIPKPIDVQNNAFKIKNVAAFASAFSYHNLKIEVFKANPPKNVREAENCRGLKDCLMDVKHITYDRLHKETLFTTHHIVMVSPQVPFLTLNPPIDGGGNPALFFYDGIVNECVQFWADVKDVDGKVYVSNCRVLKDFRY
jgi:hypothetical protein